MTRIFFVRHGDVVNPNKIWYGRLPGFGLSELGKKEISETARFLSKNKIDAIYASPLLRTKQSAIIIAKILNLKINYSNKILEIKSSFQGKYNEYIMSNTVKFNIFTDESIDHVAQRMQRFTKEIVTKYKDKNIIAVTHGDPIMIVKALVERLPMEIDSLRPVNGYIQTGEVYVAEFSS